MQIGSVSEGGQAALRYSIGVKPEQVRLALSPSYSYETFATIETKVPGVIQ
jgi:hypothetical protein